MDEHGKESLNFQFSMLIYSVIAAILMFVLIGFVLLPVLHVLNLVFVIMASLRASEGHAVSLSADDPVFEVAAVLRGCSARSPRLCATICRLMNRRR